MLGMAGKGLAVPITYNVGGTFNDGGSLVGTFEVDSSTGLLGNITNWNLTTSRGSSGISEFTYNSFTSSMLINMATLPLTWSGSLLDSRTLYLSGYTPSLDNPGPYSIGSLFENAWVGSSSMSRMGSGAGTVATPEPATLLLIGSGLVSLAGWRWKKGNFHS